MTAEAGFLGEILRVETEPGIVLQATVGYQDDTPVDRLLVIFPPHPSLGGDSDNNVVRALFQRAVARNLLAVTFDYRGVREGRVGDISLLTYWDRLEAAQDYSPIVSDALCLIRRVRDSFHSQAALWFAAYSFGNLVALAAAQKVEVHGIAGISPPLLAHDFEPWLGGKPAPIFWAAPGDVFCPAEAWEALGQRQLDVRCFPAEDHFFRGVENEVADAVLEALLGA